MANFQLTSAHLVFIRNLVLSTEEGASFSFTSSSDSVLDLENDETVVRGEFVDVVNAAGFNVFLDRKGEQNMSKEDYDSLVGCLEGLSTALVVLMHNQSDTVPGAYVLESDVWVPGKDTKVAEGKPSQNVPESKSNDEVPF